MKATFTSLPLKKTHYCILTILFLFFFNLTASAQLGVYSFTGAAACPNQNPNINSQPGNAVFSVYSNSLESCVPVANVFQYQGWNNTNVFDPNRYNQFTLTPSSYYTLTLTSITFTEYTDENAAGGSTWSIRSSLDNYAADIASGSANTTVQTPTITLPGGTFTNVGAVTFRLYLTNANSLNASWVNDEVTINGSVNPIIPADPSNPTSNSPQCSNPGVTLTSSGSAPAGETWYWQTAVNGTSIANSAPSYTVTTTGTYYIRSQNNTNLAWSISAGTLAIVITPTVGTPVFALGATSTRCQGAGTVTYTATAGNTTGITYTLDAASITGGNTIIAATGVVTYVAGWSGTSVITASAAGCNGPSTANHTVTITPNVGTPVFTMGATSFRCVGIGTVTYIASAANNLGITYSLDPASIAAGLTIDTNNGIVTYNGSWQGVTSITATAAGCGGPLTATHNASSLNPVATPVFNLGNNSTRCLGAGTVNYVATATNSVSITYSLDGSSLAGGNTINATTGDVTYTANWSGTSFVTASATGCSGPKTRTHQVTITPTVGQPIFTFGASSTRCQGAVTVTYTATATNTTGITYTLDAASITGGNTINASTGDVTYVAGWTGTSIITATASGCNGPTTANHTVTITPSVGIPVFTLGATSTRCQGAGTVTYTATATNSTGIVYALDATSLAGGNTINSSTGAVTYVAGWSGTSVIGSAAIGCNGPATASHIVTITPTVNTPVFTLGSTSTRCQVSGTVTYTATASNTTGITYTLDATSITGGNTINAASGVVTYVAGWSGTSVINASAAGCNGPKTAIHTVTINPSVGIPVFTAGTSSTRCQGAGNFWYDATAVNSTGLTYTLDAASIAGGVTINPVGHASYPNSWTGTTTITATATGCNGPTVATHTAITTPTVSTPVFTLGATSTRCQGANSVTYIATASNTSGITYTLDAASLTAGNLINSSTGMVSYTSVWTGTSTITATAAGCSGPTVATHTVTTTPTVGTPVYTLGATSIRCQLGNTVTYTANASNTTGITFSLDAVSIAGGNTINTSTGALTYSASWSGTTTITASAAGCNGPKTANHTVTITPSVGIPVFALGAASTRCQGVGTVTYIANASNTTGITYSLDAASITGGNAININTGAVNFAAAWSGTTVITASAAGCNGPKTATHTVTITPTVGTPMFTLGASSSRCHGAGTVNYSATSSNSTAITYTLDATTLAGGNTINAATGDVTYVAGWSGTTTITVSASGCNGPKTAMHTVTVFPNIGTPVFAMGYASSRQQGAATITYTATATGATGMSYSLDAASLAGGNTINAATGAVTYSVNWYTTTYITATATGCNGPTTSVHTVFINPTVVGLPLYLNNPSQVLNRVDPVSNGQNTTSSTLVFNTLASGITVDSTSSAFSASLGSTSFTMNHTTGNGQGRYMLVGISQKNVLVTGVTYAGQPLTLVGENIGSGKARMHMYQLINPPSCTAAIIVTFNSNPTSGIVVGVTTFTGVNQTTPLGTFVSANGTSTASNVTVSSSVGELVYDVSTYRNASMTAAAGQTEKSNVNSTNEIYGGASSKPGASTVTMGWTGSGSQDWALGAVSIKPALGITSTTFTESPALCNNLTIQSGINITVTAYPNILTGTMPNNPTITATLRYGATNIIILSSPVYNSVTGTLIWTGQLASNLTIPSGQSISMDVNTTQAGVSFTLQYGSVTYPSKINLPVTTYIDIVSMNIYDAPYPGGNPIVSGLNNINVYVRSIVTAPFGKSDITSMDANINPPNATNPCVNVDSTNCTRTYEYVWHTPPQAGNYDITGTAHEGLEGSVTRVLNFNINLCTVCPPVALDDSARGAGGAPIVIDVLANDYDPNNNINVSTLAITQQGNNGTGYLLNGKMVYVPNGTFSGNDTLYYRICDSTALCATAKVVITTDLTVFDPCSVANAAHTYYIPFDESKAWIALDSSTSTAPLPSNNIRTVLSIKVPYPGMVIVWDHWEDGYEANPLSPTQSSTQVWGDGNPYNGIAPGYPNDILPVGASIVLNDTIPVNPRVPSSFHYDGKDKIYASGQIALTQVCGEPSIMSVQCMKTNVTSTDEFGTSFTIPVGVDFPSQDFQYTSLFIRASQNNTIVNIDKDNNGTLEETDTLQEGQVLLINGSVKSGATVLSNKPIGVDEHFGGVDAYSSREVPIYPASWYSNTYYSPVPTTGAHSPADTNAVYFYNNLNRAISINYTSGMPSSGTITLPPKSTVRFPMPLSTTAAYKFVNPTGESFTAIQVCDSYAPGGGGAIGAWFDWAFNLISESRLTDYATIAWAPGSIDGTRDDNPIWVTPSINTTIYVKYNGDVTNGGSISPCGLHYDVSYVLNALNHKRILNLAKKDQSGIAIYTCNGAKMAAVYGEDASSAVTGFPSWDVGTTIQPFCKQKLIFANDDYARTMVNSSVTISELVNDFGFLAVVDPTTVSLTGLLQPKHGTVTINSNGTLLYTPNTGYVGNDTFQYRVCSTPAPIVCDNATVYVQIAVCPAPLNENVIAGQVFLDKNKDGLNNDGGTGYTPAKVYLYIDGNCNGIAETNELKDSVSVDSSGTYQFITYPEKNVGDHFDSPTSTNTCGLGTDGTAAWKSNWVDQGDPSVGFCNNSKPANQTHCDIFVDSIYNYALRLKNKNVSATRTVDLSGASYAFLTFSYRRKGNTMIVGHDLIVQASSDGTTFGTIFTIAGDGTRDPNYVTISNQDITNYAATTTYIRFLTNNNMVDGDSVYIDNISIHYIKYPECYITKTNSVMIPSTYHMTTPTQHSMTATSGITCLAPYDFGVAKNSVIISGTLFDDANGLTDNLVNGTTTGYLSSNTIYAYLVDSTGKVAYKSNVDPALGTYSFPQADVLSTFTVALSTYDIAIGDIAPPDANLPAGWISTGDAYGTNNGAGTGNKASIPNCSVVVKTGLVNVTNVNFGCEQLPNSDDKSASYPINVPGWLYALPSLSGTDPEDGILSTGKKYKITSLPPNAVLYYNSVSVVLNQVISSFDPTLFKIDPADNITVTSFTYAAIDAANQIDPTPATVTVDWNSVLPVISLEFTGKLNGTRVNLNWNTKSEINTDRFEVEKSTDGLNFTHLADVKAKGNSSVTNYYGAVDLNPAKGLNYYRLKMVDIDGRFVYSQVIVIKVNETIMLSTAVKPNPFTGSLEVFVSLPHASPMEIRFLDVTGKTVYTRTIKGNQGSNSFVINDLVKLAAGTYILQIKTGDGIAYEKLIKE